MFLFAGGNALAATTEDVVEGAGGVGKFGIDVLEDFGLEGKSSEDTGKDRLKDFLKGKAKSFIKDNLIGDDVTEGMGLILNRIFEGIDSKSRERANRCTTVAYNQAWGIAFDAKNTRLLRGAANIWFDILTSIPGVPALAEQLVMETGKTAYKKLRSQIEDKIKAWWASQKDEAFKLTKQTDSCTINMTVLWNKKKGKYLFLISGKCDCKLLSTGRGGSVTMKSFEVIGGGTVTPGIDLSDPNNPKVKINAGHVSNIHVNADCNCAEVTQLPPPEEDPIDEWITAPRMEARVTKAKCEACQPLLDTVSGLVADFNKLADRMDELGKEIVAERYKTPERDANIKEWNELSKQQDAVEKKHDEVYLKFAKCEEEECKLGTDPFELPHTSELDTVSTSCEECESIVTEINGLVNKHNAIANEMNILANATKGGNLKHGTVDGNKTYNKWQELSKKVTDLAGQINQKKTDLSKCEATYCLSITKFEKIPYTTACDACSDIQARLNAIEKEYNDLVDKVNRMWEDFRQYLIKGGSRGDKEAAELSGNARREGEKFSGLWDRMDKLHKELRACDPDKCNVTEGGGAISIGGGAVKVEIIDTKVHTGNDPYDPRDPIAENSENAQVGESGGSGSTSASFNANCDVNSGSGLNNVSANGTSFCTVSGSAPVIGGGTANISCAPGSTVTISAICSATICRVFVNTITNLSCPFSAPGFLTGSFGGASGFSSFASTNCTCQ